MKWIFPYIAKAWRLLKAHWGLIFLAILFLFAAASCKAPEAVSRQLEKLPPQALERLARLPYLGPYFVPRVAPKALLEKARKKIEEAQFAGAPIYAPDLLRQAQDYFLRGETFYQEKRFIWAKYYLKKAVETAEKASTKSTRVREKAQSERRERLAELEDLIAEGKQPLSPQEELELRLKLKELALLIEEEKFQEFDRKWQTLWQAIKQKRGPKPPFTHKMEGTRPRLP